MASSRHSIRSRRSARSAARPELLALSEALAAAEARALEAEQALPDLLALGRRTADSLLDDARRRGQAMLAEAHRRADAELDAQRREVRREAQQLEALRMAVAAEAMGLERIRAELQHRVALSAAEMHRIASHPGLLGGGPLRLEPVDVAELATARGIAAASAPDVVIVTDDDEATVVRSAPSPRFAEAWGTPDDPESEAAFAAFFSDEIASEPSRDWILAGDEAGSSPTGRHRS